MSDEERELVDRLRGYAPFAVGASVLVEDAADTIERLVRERDEARNSGYNAAKAQAVKECDDRLDHYHAQKDLAFKLDRGERWERFENYRDAVDNIRGIIDAMEPTDDAKSPAGREPQRGE